MKSQFRWTNVLWGFLAMSAFGPVILVFILPIIAIVWVTSYIDEFRPKPTRPRVHMDEAWLSSLP